jgi:hypothetical protein
MQFAFIIAVTIIMLNVLVAQLTLTYEKVMAYARPSMLKHRASVCLDLESCLPMSLRLRVYTAIGFDQPLPFSLSDVGPCGGIQEWQADGDVERYVPLLKEKKKKRKKETSNGMFKFLYVCM